jgi:phosphoribosylamine--glycine ligase
MVSEGYPGSYAKGLPISGLQEVAQLHDTWIFHAGTSLQNNRISTNGGRVLGVTARGESIAAAIEQAYQAVGCIHWPGVHYRRDIGYRAMQRLTSEVPGQK